VDIARHKPLGLAGLILIAIMVIVAVFAPLIATHDPVATDTLNQLEGPSSEHWFGTDHLGRDTFSRVVYGTRTSLAVGFGAVALGTTLAVLLGVVSAYYGGALDLVTQRLVDAVMALPWLILIMSVMALIGPGVVNIILVLGFLTAPGASRVIRGATLSVGASPYVDSARALGCRDHQIIIRHVLPNVAAPMIVIATIGLGAAILAEAALSFLGFGVVPPEPSLGQMLSVEGRKWMLKAPWIAIFPGIAISLAVFGFNMLGDALRDVLDPRLRTGERAS
jgi:peptide/nickel transport system permease protein